MNENTPKEAAPTNWAETVLECCEILRSDGMFCDLNLLSSDQTQFSAHSVILAVASPVIKNLVVTSGASHTTLSFPDIDNQVWQYLLHLFYTGNTLKPYSNT